MNGADLIAARLVSLGVRSVFSVAGASHAHLLQALEAAGIRIISSRHESGAVSAADGYARAHRGLGVALIVAEQGLPNAIGGLAAAYAANSPVLVLMAMPPAQFVEQRAIVDHDKLELVEPLSKSACVINSASTLGEDLDASITAALSGRPGPAVIGLPADVVVAPANYPNAALDIAASPTTLDARPIDTAARWLHAARRPLIVAGAGAYWCNAGAGLTRLKDDFGIPVAANGIGRGVVPEDWLTSFSWPFAQLAAHQSDCVLLVGARLTQRLGFGLPPRFAANAKFIQIDIDADEANRNRPTDCFIHADAGPAVQALANAMKHLGKVSPQRKEWLRNALAPRFAAVQTTREAATTSSAGIHPLVLGHAIAQRLPADALYVGDGADIQSWMYGEIAIRHAPGFMDHYPLGAMGIGTPLAVGAATADDDDAAATGGETPHTVLVTGDGAFGFQPAELHAASMAGLKLVVIIGNDGAWGTEVYDQRHNIGTDINTQLEALPYERVAEGFGCTGLRVDTVDQLGPALDAAFATDGPVVVNVRIDPAAGAALRQDDNLRMIVFSDIQAGKALLAKGRGPGS